MGGIFPNITIGGGTAFQELQNQLLGITSADVLGRAGVAENLFSRLFDAQLQANRRPLSIVDQLLLQGEVGNIMPLSQAGPAQLARFQTPSRNNLLQDLYDRLDIFSSGANPVGQREVRDEQRRTFDIFQAKGIDAATSQRIAQNPDAFNKFVGLAGGGKVVSDEPIMGVGLLSGKKRFILGERGPEELEVTPLEHGGTVKVSPQVDKAVEKFGQGGIGADITKAVQATPPKDVVITRDERFRIDELRHRSPEVDFETAARIAHNPAAFEQFTGVQSDPRAVASRLLGGGISGDPRFSDAFVRALALGRAPRPGVEFSTREANLLSKDNLEALQGIVGVDNFEQFIFELGNMTPQGARTSTVGGVRF